MKFIFFCSDFIHFLSVSTLVSLSSALKNGSYFSCVKKIPEYWINSYGDRVEGQPSRNNSRILLQNPEASTERLYNQERG